MKVVRFTALLAVAVAVGCTFPGSEAQAQSLTLHPYGGAKWVAKQGLPDTKGNAKKGLDVTGGGANISGLEGYPASVLVTLAGLSWEIKGPYGNTPAWQLFVRDPDGGNYTVNLPCNGAGQYLGSAPEWIFTLYTGSLIAQRISLATGGIDPDFLTITGLRIVGGPNPTTLDNIKVGIFAAWGSPSDNGQ